MSIVYVILAILLFGLLVIVHELGHFTVAKLCGVKVEEFAVGMGPVIFQRQKGEPMMPRIHGGATMVFWEGEFL